MISKIFFNLDLFKLKFEKKNSGELFEGIILTFLKALVKR